MAKFFDSNSGIEELIEWCIERVGKNIFMVREEKPDSSLGYIWCVPDAYAIHYSPISISDWYSEEIESEESQQYYDAEQIICLLEREWCKRVGESQKPLLFALFSVFHEIGHCIDYANDPADFERRADSKRLAFDKLRAWLEKQATDGARACEAYPFFCQEYRRLPCEYEADRFALSRIAQLATEDALNLYSCDSE